MTTVAVIGQGKLGLPVSCAMTQRGHTVYGYDIDADLRDRLRSGDCPYYEPDADGMLQDALVSGLYICDTVEAAVKVAEIIFIAVPTPSYPDHSFDTSYVGKVLIDVAPYIGKGRPYKVVSVISTVLPGTCRSRFLPILERYVGCLPGEHYGFAYNAQFIAMGTVVEDFLRPEFVLVGEYDRHSGDVLAAFYTQVINAPVLRMSIESAETTKMAYNCYVGSKLIIANAIMELCHNVPGADCDVVSDALSRSHNRILGPRYMRGGMGDGGNCHGRDNLALSYLSQQLSLSTDPFAYTQQARDDQSRGLARLVSREANKTGLPIAILGITFKPETNLTDFSPCLLLGEHLQELGLEPCFHDPIVQPNPLPNHPHLFIIAMRHGQYRRYPFPPGSTIIDPWRMLSRPPEGCTYIPIGRTPLEVP